MRYVLGIDQGGSKTHAVLAEETGKILGMGKSYGACHSSTSVDYAVQAVMEAAEQALKACNLTAEDITGVAGGLTGIDWDYEAELLEGEIQKQFPRADIKVVNDSIIAMRAATRKKKCGILCAGSGLNCAVQNGSDCFAYGFYIPDEYQGGWSLGKRSVQAVFDSHMGLIEETSLTERLLEYFCAGTVDELLFMQVKGKITSKDYLHLPIILEEEAQAGDKVALNIWIQYGKVMVNYLAARIKKTGILEDAVDIVLSGSIFKCKLEQFQDTVKTEIVKKIPNANIIAAEYEPVMGAVFIALEELLGKMTEEIYSNAEGTSKNFPLRRMEK